MVFNTRPSDAKRGLYAGGYSWQRMVWLTLFLLHVWSLPSLARLIGAEGDMGHRMVLLVRLVGMAASAGFFLLKVFGVPWFRLAPGWRSAITMVVIVALLHVGVVDRAIGGDFQFAPEHLGVVFFVGAMWQVERLARGLRGALSRITPSGALPDSDETLLGLARQTVFRPHARLFIPALSVPRAPPTI